MESSVEEAIEHLTTREWVWSTLGRLPEDLQLTAALRYFSSYSSSYEEISAVLGVPMGTVKSRLNTVRLMLAEALLETAGLEHHETRRLTLLLPRATFKGFTSCAVLVNGGNRESTVALLAVLTKRRP